jgi:hypothetical protein
MMPENLASATSAECNRGKGETGPAAMCPHENTRAHLSLVALAASARVRLRLKKGHVGRQCGRTLGTFPCRRPNATSAANSGFDRPSMIALASSRIPELGARWKRGRLAGNRRRQSLAGQAAYTGLGIVVGDPR